ncbi:metal ABC transporter permease [Ruminococcaceae bacterium OttesenSCG-928-A16]|nr:metal ABC transporter permease [Ruminococcaceae bacterium OttesenSCG-928-A16]
MAFLRQVFAYPFMVRALVVGGIVALCAALLGVTLVLKRYSMIGDGLSHVGFGTLSIAMALQMVFPAFANIHSPLLLSLPIVVVAAVLLLRLSANSSIKGDAAIAIVSSSALAIGIIAASLTAGMNIDVMNFLFGSILSITGTDVVLSCLVAVLVLGLYIVFFNKIFAITFDENFAKATGTNAGTYNTLLAVLTALVIVVGMRIMGAMLISCLIIFPAITSMRIFKSFKAVVVCSAGVSLFCFFTGMLLSFGIPTLPSGATIVVVNLAVFLVFSAMGLLLRHRAKP